MFLGNAKGVSIRQFAVLLHCSKRLFGRDQVLFSLCRFKSRQIVEPCRLFFVWCSPDILGGFLPVDMNNRQKMAHALVITGLWLWSCESRLADLL